MAMSNTPRLFVGGPAHGRWVNVHKGQTVVRVPAPVHPTIWQEGDELYPTPVEHVYTVQEVFVFGQVGLIMVCDCCLPDMIDLQRALVDALLSDDGKKVLGR